jgi:hypothetical protein
VWANDMHGGGGGEGHSAVRLRSEMFMNKIERCYSDWIARHFAIEPRTGEDCQQIFVSR